MKSPIQFFVAMAVLLAAATVTAQVYKWVDKDGKVQFSDVPPPRDAKSGEAKKIEVRSASGAPAAPKAPPTDAKDAPKADVNTKAAPKTLAERAKESDKRREEAAEAAKKAAEVEQLAKAWQERCKDATRVLAEINSGRPMAGTDEQGGRKILDDAARAAEAAKARAAMSEACGK